MLVTSFVFAIGAFTAFLSVSVCCKFYAIHRKAHGASKDLAFAITLQLIGEFIIGMGTLTFSVAAHFGVLDSWSIEIQSTIRTVMFLSNSVTTIHLLNTLHLLKKGYPN